MPRAPRPAHHNPGSRARIVVGESSRSRAIASRPTVLLLDEATSSLDVTTEATIERNLRGAAATRIVIAHRLSTVRDADQILVLEDGRIVERGTHEALMARDGAYAALVRQHLDGSSAAPHSGVRLLAG